MTTKTGKQLAEDLLGSILIGASVSGVRFGTLQLLFDPELPVPGEPYINLSSAWTIFSGRPSAFAENESDLAEVTEEEEIDLAVSLRHRVVAAVEILEPWPHLVLTFTDSSVLYLNGKNERYEPWTAGLSHAAPEDDVTVIAGPGGELSFLLPPGRSAKLE